jgi:hypothetical protein
MGSEQKQKIKIKFKSREAFQDKKKTKTQRNISPCLNAENDPGSTKINIKRKKTATPGGKKIQTKPRFDHFPFDKLSKNIKSKILSYFNYDFNVKAVIRQVCCEWNTLLKTEPCLQITELVIDPAFLFTNLFNKRASLKSEDPRTGLKAAVDRMNGITHHELKRFIRDKILRNVDSSKLTKFEIKLFGDKLNIITEDYMSELIRNMPSITSLDLTSVRFFTDPLSGFRPHFLLFAHAPNLVKLDLTSSDVCDVTIVSVLEICPKLESLILCKTGINGMCLLSISNETSLLKELDLRLCELIDAGHVNRFLSNYSKLTRFYIDELQVNLEKPILYCYENLVTLQIKINDPESYLRLENWGSLFARLKSLAELNLSRSQCSYTESINYIVASALNKCSLLTVLNLNYCNTISDGAFCSVMPVNTQLVELQIAGSQVTIHAFANLAETLNLKSLCSLNLAECTHLNEAHVGVILSEFLNIKTIGVSFTNDQSLAINTIGYLDFILLCKERYFNLYGLNQEETLDIVIEYLRTKETSLGFNSIGHKNFRIYFENMDKLF